MKRLFRLSSVATIAALVLLSLPRDANAQRRSVSIDGGVQSLLTASQLNGGDLLLYGGRLTLAPHGWARIGVGLDYAGEATVPDIQRPFSLLAPSVSLEGALVGDVTRLYATLAPTLLLFDLDARGALIEERVTVPALAAGLGVQAAVYGPVNLQVEVRDLMTWTRGGQLVGLPSAEREFGHSPSLVARISVQFRRRDRIARFEDLPVSFGNSFQPLQVRAAGTQDSTLLRTQGTAHTHETGSVERGTEVPRERVTAEEGSLLGSIYFESGSSAVAPAQQAVVRKVADFLRDNPDAKVAVRGFTSPTGNSRYNATLAQQRAQAVREQLVDYYQISGQRVDALTGGIDPESGQAKARRVEIRVVRTVTR